MITHDNTPSFEPEQPYMHQAAVATARHQFHRQGHANITAIAETPNKTELLGDLTYRTAAVLGGMVTARVQNEQFRGYRAILLEQSTARRGGAWELLLTTGSSYYYRGVLTLDESMQTFALSQPDGSQALGELTTMDDQGYGRFRDIVQHTRFTRRGTRWALKKLAASGRLGGQDAFEAAEAEAARQRGIVPRTARVLGNYFIDMGKAGYSHLFLGAEPRNWNDPEA